MSDTHEHEWKDSRQMLGLVGDLYWRMYPDACKCGALRTPTGKIIEPKKGEVTL